MVAQTHENMHTAAEWLRLQSEFVIGDREGWNDGTWDTPITKGEFESRAALCVSWPLRRTAQKGRVR